MCFVFRTPAGIVFSACTTYFSFFAPVDASLPCRYGRCKNCKSCWNHGRCNFSCNLCWNHALVSVEGGTSAPESLPPPTYIPAPPSPSISGSAAPASPDRDEEVVDTDRALSERYPRIGRRLFLFLKQNPRKGRCHYPACTPIRCQHAG